MFKHYAYIALSVLAILLVTFLVYEFMMGHFRLAWASAILVALCVEMRVQIGGRLPRTTLFWIHIGTAIPFITTLTILAFYVQPLWLQYVTAILFLAMFNAGARLWYYGLQAHVHFPSAREN